MKVRIQSGGKLNDATVTLSTGERLPRVRNIAINLTVKEVPRATIEILLMEVDVIAEAEVIVTVLPDGRRYLLVAEDYPDVVGRAKTA